MIAGNGATHAMDIFEIRDEVIEDYKSFTTSFVEPRDERIKVHVDQLIDDGGQWPDPWISLNPFFASGGSITDAVTDGVLHPECARIFRVKADEADPGSRELTLHRHQRDAIDVARSGHSYVLTTGTGSGKSLSYIVPIVDRVLREKAANPNAPKSVKAIVVYPMNALANSQLGELKKFLTFGYGAGNEPVTYARYTGQESDEQRQEILANPPDILLTNYVMLEYLLTRPQERTKLIRAAQGLQFLVLDELHTYRGRQGSDVAMLVRRVREACNADDLQCVGTSATMSSGGTLADQRAVVAQVASRLFGADITPDRVIGETLKRATLPEPGNDTAALTARLQQPPPESFETLQADPLASWVESNFGLRWDDTEQLEVRQRPQRIPPAAELLAEATGCDASVADTAIRATLAAGSKARHPVTDRPLFAFRLHQFLSKGDNVYVSLDDPAQRYITSRYQVAVPGDAGKALYPLAFCRECGQEYLVAAREEAGGQWVFRPRMDRDGTDGADAGYVYVSEDLPWPTTLDQVLADHRLPDSWLVTDDTGESKVIDSRRDRVPVPMMVMSDGTQVSGKGTGKAIETTDPGVRAAFVPSPFAFCLRCQVSYESLRGSEFSRLASLSSEGRSSAVTVVTSGLVRALKRVSDADFDDRARKLLTFVDNRQDASLQAGHVNDYVQVSLLRSALHRAVADAGPDGVSSVEVAAATIAAMPLQFSDYAIDPDPAPRLRKATNEALRRVVAYRLYVDLERGWRITMPNLEQTGLLRVEYEDLDWLAAQDSRWEGSHEALTSSDADHRAELMRVLLDEMRWSLAIDVAELQDDGFQLLRSHANQALRPPWGMEADEKMAGVRTAYARGTRGSRGTPLDALYLSGRGALGRYLRADQRFPHLSGRLSTDDAQTVIADLLRVAEGAGLVRQLDADSDGIPGYRVNADAMRWLAGDGTAGVEDPLRRHVKDEAGAKVNPFFRDLYRSVSADLANLRAAEHTAQVPPPVREEREEQFREHPEQLPMLFCSPTMELGVDIASLNAVAMRNVPPTPANYAQRSGRAGRSGQPAIVMTYCATGNAHDSYYFARSDAMVAGAVTAPRLDLGNEDLIRSHVHAIWLAETGQKLGKSMLDVLAVESDAQAMPIRTELQAALGDDQVEARALTQAQRVLAGIEDDLRDTTWYDDQWLPRAVQQSAAAFDRACNRWRELYRAAADEQREQNRIVNDPSSSQPARRAATARRGEAEAQLRLLRNEDSDQALTDFYPYRYFASEGFLPGYSFPRLPLAAFIPSRRRRADNGDYLQRARFLAISEFGPGSLIYHEGARYQVERVQLPAASPDDPGAIQTTDIRRCESCGYLHDRDELTDDCAYCGAALAATTYGLMQLRTVFTRRRERISSDEEERRRASFELQVSYRFADRGNRPGSTRATALTPDCVPLLHLTYGDAATMRIANLGRRRRKAGEQGFWLDTVTGKWLSDHAATVTTSDGELDDAGAVTTKRKVIPYVEDTRNILITRSATPLTHEQAVTLRTALERGIEAAFQLEGSELATQKLPDDNDQARSLFMEANEGGAGVLRRLVDEPAALATAAREALQIAHFDPDTGADLLADAVGDQRCEKACYDCLLAYENQIEHTFINRHSIRDLLLAVATSSTTLDDTAGSPVVDDLMNRCDSQLERDFLTYLADHDHRLPDAAQELVPDAHARPDFTYHTRQGPVAVFIDGPHHDATRQQQRDGQAQDRLEDLGWLSVRIRHDDDWPTLVTHYSQVFGEGR